ncbi:MAG: prepilin-type N-terminal cleavage/methylation domain-containing protein [Neisseriaceae bacterium]|nr:prepilin-type N-terminal cleavage/methylation domain-containing protein [Neisseriaceae bacterium]
MFHSKQRGFTLTELMITVAVLAILAAIAIPSFKHFTRTAHIRAAQAALIENAYAMEQYYIRNRNFGTTDPASGGVTYPAEKEDKKFNQRTEHFDIEFAKDDSTACANYPRDSNHYCMLAKPNGKTGEKRVLTINEKLEIKICEENSATAKCRFHDSPSNYKDK